MLPVTFLAGVRLMSTPIQIPRWIFTANSQDCYVDIVDMLNNLDNSVKSTSPRHSICHPFCWSLTLVSNLNIWDHLGAFQSMISMGLFLNHLFKLVFHDKPSIRGQPHLWNPPKKIARPSTSLAWTRALCSSESVTMEVLGDQPMINQWSNGQNWPQIDFDLSSPFL